MSANPNSLHILTPQTGPSAAPSATVSSVRKLPLGYPIPVPLFPTITVRGWSLGIISSSSSSSRRRCRFFSSRSSSSGRVIFRWRSSNRIYRVLWMICSISLGRWCFRVRMISTCKKNSSNPTKITNTAPQPPKKSSSPFPKSRSPSNF